MGEGGRLTTHLATGAMRFRVWPPIDRAQAGSQAEGGKREGGGGGKHTSTGHGVARYDMNITKR